MVIYDPFPCPKKKEKKKKREKKEKERKAEEKKQLAEVFSQVEEIKLKLSIMIAMTCRQSFGSRFRSRAARRVDPDRGELSVCAKIGSFKQNDWSWSLLSRCAKTASPDVGLANQNCSPGVYLVVRKRPPLLFDALQRLLVLDGHSFPWAQSHEVQRPGSPEAVIGSVVSWPDQNAISSVVSKHFLRPSRLERTPGERRRASACAYGLTNCGRIVLPLHGSL